MKKVKFLLMALVCASMLNSAELPTRKVLNMAALKSMAAAAEAEALKRNVHITLAIVDESLNLLYLEHGDDAAVNTILLAQKKARHAAAFHSPSRLAAESAKTGNLSGLAMPDYFPIQGGLPIKVDTLTIGGIGVSGAASEVDEAIAQAALDATVMK
jgi:glc operon protein GlcG